jgi:hypothetical protein
MFNPKFDNSCFSLEEEMQQYKHNQYIRKQELIKKAKFAFMVVAGLVLCFSISFFAVYTEVR